MLLLSSNFSYCYCSARVQNDPSMNFAPSGQQRGTNGSLRNFFCSRALNDFTSADDDLLDLCSPDDSTLLEDGSDQRLILSGIDEDASDWERFALPTCELLFGFLNLTCGLVEVVGWPILISSYNATTALPQFLTHSNCYGANVWPSATLIVAAAFGLRVALSQRRQAVHETIRRLRHFWLVLSLITYISCVALLVIGWMLRWVAHNWRTLHHWVTLVTLLSGLVVLVSVLQLHGYLATKIKNARLFKQRLFAARRTVSHFLEARFGVA